MIKKNISPFKPKNFLKFRPQQFKIYTFNSGFKKYNKDLLVIVFDKLVPMSAVYTQSSMPSAVLTFLISEIYSPKKISNSIASTVALSTFMSFFTLIVVVFIALKYFN